MNPVKHDEVLMPFFRFSHQPIFSRKHHSSVEYRKCKQLQSVQFKLNSYATNKIELIAKLFNKCFYPLHTLSCTSCCGLRPTRFTPDGVLWLTHKRISHVSSLSYMRRAFYEQTAQIIPLCNDVRNKRGKSLMTTESIRVSAASFALLFIQFTTFVRCAIVNTFWVRFFICNWEATISVCSRVRFWCKKSGPRNGARVRSRVLTRFVYLCSRLSFFWFFCAFIQLSPRHFMYFTNGDPDFMFMGRRRR